VHGEHEQCHKQGKGQKEGHKRNRDVKRGEVQKDRLWTMDRNIMLDFVTTNHVYGLLIVILIALLQRLKSF
jgi:hypothetical protein